MSDLLPIHDLSPFTMLDFPGRVSAIIWFAGCNMRCLYCHNPDIVKGKSGKLSQDSVLSFLKDRFGLLDGVVLSGGEATLYAGIIPFVHKIRAMDYAIKLDTNGTRPQVIRQMLEESLLDYIALDYKAPENKFRAVTGIKNKSPFDETLDLLCKQEKAEVEIRTTVHTGLLDEKDIDTIAQDLRQRGYTGRYYVQNYRAPSGKTLGNMPPQPRELSKETHPRLGIAYRNFST